MVVMDVCTRRMIGVGVERAYIDEFSPYYNRSRIHQSLSGHTPEEKSGKARPA